MANNQPTEFFGKYSQEEIEVTFKKINEIIESPINQKPIVILADSGSGKTTFAIDVITKFAPQLNYCYFVSQTTASIMGTSLSKIPNFFVRNIKPDEDPFERINGIWDDIKSRGDAMGMDSARIPELLGIIFPGIPMYDYIEKYVQSVTDSPQDAGILKAEIITRIILDEVMKNESILSKLNDQQRKMICGLITPSINSLFILDDMTSILSSMKSGKETVDFNGTKMKKADAYKGLLTDIFTRGRHYNCIVMIFLHNIDAIDVGETVGSIDNLIIMDQKAYAKILGTRRLNGIKEKLKFIVEKTGVYKFKYYSLFINISDSRFYITKADYYKDTKDIRLSPTRAKFHAILNKIINQQMNPSFAPLTTQDNNQKEESFEDILDMDLDQEINDFTI